MIEAFTYLDLKEFGALLRRRRKELGLSMIDVSTTIGIGRNHYGRIEAGKLTNRTAFMTIFKILTCLKLYWSIELRPIPEETMIPIHLSDTSEKE